MPATRASGKGLEAGIKGIKAVARLKDAAMPSTRATPPDSRVERLFERSGLSTEAQAITKSGYCLRKAVKEIYEVDHDQVLVSLMEQHGLPGFYQCLAGNTCRHEATQDLKDPQTSFQSLCRIIVGQFISGLAAQAAWKRLMTLFDGDLTPELILQAIQQGDVESKIKAPVGVTRAKALSIVDLAHHFQDGRLSETLLLEESNDEVLRKKLLAVRGLGPWSVDMFLMFYLERPNVLPLGDLGVRKGISRVFFGNKQLSQKDAPKIRERLSIYEPHHLSLLTYYMWRAADTPSVMEAKEKQDTSSAAGGSVSSPSKSDVSPPSGKRRKLVRKVTP